MSVSTAIKLRQAGFDDKQIEVLDALVSGEAATKVDLVEAKAELKAEAARVEGHLANRIDRLEAALRAEIAALRADNTQLKQLGLLIAGGVIALFVRSFFG